MNGGQDLGGMHGFGPVRPEAGEPVFHAGWERRVFALAVAAGATGAWNIDMARHAREALAPPDYLRASYYEIWYCGLARLLLDGGLADAGELAAGRSRSPGVHLPHALPAADVAAKLARGWPAQRPADGAPPAAFAVGDRVQCRVDAPPTHTRLPRYCRGRCGVVAALHGRHVFPDSHAAGRGEDPQWMYAVRFAAHDLWGPHTTASSVTLSCWEPYLERAA